MVVTGAGGFVGSAVVRSLLRSAPRPVFADGTPVERVVALVRPGGPRERLAPLPPDESWSVAEADLGLESELAAALAEVRPRVIVHVALDRAAYRTDPRAGDDPLTERPLRTLLAALDGVEGARFVHTSSAWVLRPGEGLAEDAPLEPRSPYARHKALADELVPALAERHGVPWLTLRPFNLFGRYEDPRRLVPYVVSQLAARRNASLSHGEQVRDFNDVDVVADAYGAAIRAPDRACGAVYHLGSGQAATAREVASLVARELGRPELVRFGTARTPDDSVPALVADPRRAGDVLGWSNDEPLESAVRRAVAWWLPRLGGLSPHEAEVAV